VQLCVITQLFSVVVCVGRAVCKFDVRLVVNETPNKSDQWEGHEVPETHVFDSEVTLPALYRPTAFSLVRDNS
jgi:hypothetical protein